MEGGAAGPACGGRCPAAAGGAPSCPRPLARLPLRRTSSTLDAMGELQEPWEGRRAVRGWPGARSVLQEEVGALLQRVELALEVAISWRLEGEIWPLPPKNRLHAANPAPPNAWACKSPTRPPGGSIQQRCQCVGVPVVAAPHTAPPRHVTDWRQMRHPPPRSGGAVCAACCPGYPALAQRLWHLSAHLCRCPSAAHVRHAAAAPLLPASRCWQVR